MGIREDIDCLRGLYEGFLEQYLTVKESLRISRVDDISSKLISTGRIVSSFRKPRLGKKTKIYYLEMGLDYLASAERIAALPSSRLDYQE